MTQFKVLYFASLGDALGTTEETISTEETINTIADLKNWLAKRGDHWQQQLNTPTVKCAVNQALATACTAISDGNEIAFFPPVTGG